MKKSILLIIVLFSILNIYGQYNCGTNRVVPQGCGAEIYDDGGQIGNYGNNRNDTITIHTNDTFYPRVFLILNEFDIDPSDTLFVYDGADANPLKLISGGPLNVPWFNNSNPIQTDSSFFIASITNLTGAITLRFKTNSSNNSAGFKISTNCWKACQKIIANINTLASTPPIVTENGFLYSNVCQDQPLTIKGFGTYPENNIVYSQSDLTSNFFWMVNDTGWYFGIGMSTLTLPYPLFQATNIKLQILDTHECENRNYTNVRIRSSLNPIIKFPDTYNICLGDSIFINAGYPPESDIQLMPIHSSTANTSDIDSALHIPDGQNCPQTGDCLVSDIFITNYPTYAYLQSANDIQSIVLNIEHSNLGDLQIRLTCPNGQPLLIHANPNGSGLFLGAPTDDEGGCEYNSELIGDGWNYAWSQNTNLGFSYHGNNQSYIHQDQSNPSCDSTDLTNNSNYYKPMNSFASLIGCPLTGVWSIQICDVGETDDGYLFNWSLNFNPELYEEVPWEYNLGIEEVLWSGSYITSSSDTTALIIPQQSGLYDYSYTVIDDFGCSYDSTFTVNIFVTEAIISFDGHLLSSNSATGNQWYSETNTGITIIPNAIGQTYEPLENGIYFSVVDNYYCGLDTSNKINIQDLSINSLNKLNPSISPNPAQTYITIKTPTSYLSSETSIEIISLDGKIISKLNTDKSTTKIDVSNLKSGIYYVRISNNSNINVQKLLISR